MRIWSVHPKYLDSKGLVALWRETLLAKKVLEGTTKGYKNHSQLVRFKVLADSNNAINYYLSELYAHSLERGYNFNKDKFCKNICPVTMEVSDKQLAYEFEHLLRKLFVRDRQRFEELKSIRTIEPHPMFQVISGEIASWEVLKVSIGKGKR